ncbi:DUF2807 domain-containing protein [Salmonella enterica]
MINIKNKNVRNRTVINGFGTNIIEGNGEIVTQSRLTKEFTSVIVEGSVDVNITCCVNPYLEIIGDSNVINLISTTIKLGVLHIECKGSFSIQKPIIVNCSTYILTEASVRGSGDIAMFDLDQEQLSLCVQGSGDISSTGKIKRLKAVVQGSGDIDCSDLYALMSDVAVHGSGDIRVFSTDMLTAECLGSGDIKVYGNPQKRNVREIGSGKVKFR